MEEIKWNLKRAIPAVLLMCKVCDSAATPLLSKLLGVIVGARDFEDLFSKIKTALEQIGDHDVAAAEEEAPDPDCSDSEALQTFRFQCV